MPAPVGLIAITLFIIILLFAIYKEYAEACDSYRQSTPDKNNSTDEILKKIVIGSNYDLNSVKWRRCLILSSIQYITVMVIIKYIMGLNLNLKTSTLLLVLFFVSNYTGTIYHQNVISTKAVKNINECVNQLTF